MVMCWAPDCKHYNNRETCKFFKFPTEANARRLWKKLIRRDAEPGPGAFICSCHFVDRKRENGPTLFVHNIAKNFTFESPERRKRRKTNEADDRATKEQSDQSSAYQASTSSLEENLVTIERNKEEPQPSTSGSTDAACQSLPPSMSLEAENYFLQQELEKMQTKLGDLSTIFCYKTICQNDKLILLYTGIPNNNLLKALLDMFGNIKVNYFYNWTVQKIEREDQILMTLMKLRQNFPHEDLAVRFNVSQSTVSNIVTTWIYVLHEVLFKTFMATIPPRSKNKLCLPNCFSTFTNCRIIIDCTEISTAVPRSSMLKQKQTYSSYKHKNTWKGLVGVAPNGVITYVSDLYPGSTSDKKIVINCGLLHQLEAGDLILADKGFLIKDCVPPGVAVNIPPFLNTPQFTPAQVQQTESIARARIHVERAIRRMKSFRILAHIPQTLVQHADAIFQVVAALTNLQFPLIKEVEDYSGDTQI